MHYSTNQLSKLSFEMTPCIFGKKMSLSVLELYVEFSNFTTVAYGTVAYEKGD